MVARPIWTGFISFGLVLIPARLFSAEKASGGLDLDMIDPRDGARIRYKRVNEKTGEEVAWKDIAKGFKLPSGDYVILTDKDFQKAAATIRRGVEIDDFVKRDEISPLLYDKPYYLAPGKGGEKLMGLLHETLTKTGRVGIARVVFHSREKLGVIMPVERALALITLRYDEELKELSEVPGAALHGGHPTAKERDLAGQLVGQLSASFAPERYHDEYQATLKRFIVQRAKSGVLQIEEKETKALPAPANVTLADLLAQSVKQGKRGVRKKSSTKTSARSKSRTKATASRKPGKKTTKTRKSR